MLEELEAPPVKEVVGRKTEVTPVPVAMGTVLLGAAVTVALSARVAVVVATTSERMTVLVMVWVAVVVLASACARTARGSSRAAARVESCIVDEVFGGVLVEW